MRSQADKHVAKMSKRMRRGRRRGTENWQQDKQLPKLSDINYALWRRTSRTVAETGEWNSLNASNCAYA